MSRALLLKGPTKAALALVAVLQAATIRAEEPYPVVYQKKMLDHFERWHAEARKFQGVEYRFRVTCRDRSLGSKEEYQGQAMTLTASDMTKAPNETSFDWNLAEIQIKTADPGATLCRQYLYTKENSHVLDFQAKSMAVLPAHFNTAQPQAKSNLERFNDLQKIVFHIETETYRKLLSPQFPVALSHNCRLIQEDDRYRYFAFNRVPGLNGDEGRVVLRKETGLPSQLHLVSGHFECTFDIESIKPRNDLRDSHFLAFPKIIPEGWVDRFHILSDTHITVTPWTESPEK